MPARVVFFCTYHYSDLFPWSDSSIQQTSDRLVLCCATKLLCGNNQPSSSTLARCPPDPHQTLHSKALAFIADDQSDKELVWNQVFLLYKMFLRVLNSCRRLIRHFWRTYQLGLLFQCRLSQNAKVLKCYAPDAFSGAKFQVFLENGHEIDVG